MITTSIAALPAPVGRNFRRPGPFTRFLVVAACLVGSSGCESLKLIAERIAHRPETQSQPGPPAAAATSTAETASQAPRTRVTVLDPDDFVQAGNRHLQELIRVSSNPLAPEEVGYYMDVQNAQLARILHPTSIEIGYEGGLIILTMPGGESFAPDSARLEDAAIRSLNLASRVLLEYSQTRITIHGHTDDTGEAGYNQLLSVRRALSVADRLVTAGIAAERIAVVGFGESRPLAFNTASAERARNRRIELYLDPIGR